MGLNNGAKSDLTRGCSESMITWMNGLNLYY